MPNDEEKKDFQLNFYEFLGDEEESSKDTAEDRNSKVEEKDFSSFEEEPGPISAAPQAQPLDPSIKQDIDDIKALLDERETEEDTGFKPVIKDPDLPEDVLEIIDAIEKKTDGPAKDEGLIPEKPPESALFPDGFPDEEPPEAGRLKDIIDIEESNDGTEEGILEAAPDADSDTHPGEESAPGEIPSLEEIITPEKDDETLSIDGINVKPEPEMDLDALLSEVSDITGITPEAIEEPAEEEPYAADLPEEVAAPVSEKLNDREKETEDTPEIEEITDFSPADAVPVEDAAAIADDFSDIDKFLEKEGLAQAADESSGSPETDLDGLESLLENTGAAKDPGIEDEIEEALPVEEPLVEQKGAAAESGKDDGIKAVISDLSDMLDGASHESGASLETKEEAALPADLLDSLREFESQASGFIGEATPDAGPAADISEKEELVPEIKEELPPIQAEAEPPSGPDTSSGTEKDFMEFNLDNLSGDEQSVLPAAPDASREERSKEKDEGEDDLSELSFGAIPEEEQTPGERSSGSYLNSDEFYEQVQDLPPAIRAQILRKISAEKLSENEIIKYIANLRSGGVEVEAAPKERREIELKQAVYKEPDKEKKPRSLRGIGVFAGIAAGALLLLVSLYFIVTGITLNYRINALARKIAAYNIKDIEADIASLDGRPAGREKLYKMLSLGFMNIKNYPLAGKYLEKLINLKPGNLAYRNLLVKYYILTGNLLSAKEECQKIIDIEPRGLDGLLNMSDIYLILKDYEKARDRVHRALQLYPRNLDALLQLRKVYVKEGDTKRALAIHLDLMSKAGKSLSTLDANLELVNLYINEKQLDNAKKLVDGLIISNQQSPRARYYRARIFYQKKEEEAAIKDIKYALELKPDYAECYALLGDIYYKSRMIKQADESYRKAAELFKGRSEPRGEALTLLSLANLYYLTGQTAKAEAQHALAMKHIHRHGLHTHLETFT